MYISTTPRFSLFFFFFFFFFFFSRQMVSVMCLKYTRSLHTLCSCLRNASRKGLKEEGELKKKILFRVFQFCARLFFSFSWLCDHHQGNFISVSPGKKEKIDLKHRGGRVFSQGKTYLEKTRKAHPQTIKRSSLFVGREEVRANRPRREDKTGTRRRSFRWKVFSSNESK